MLVTLRGVRVQELLQLVIISSILMTIKFDSGVILWGKKGSDLLLRCLNHHGTSKHETLSGPFQKLCTLKLVAYCLFCRNLMDDNLVCYKIPNFFGCM